MGNRALVTGGAGFIGSHLVDRLDALGWSVDVVDNMSNGSIRFVPKHLREEHLWIHDFASDGVLDTVRKQSYDIVFHLAAVPRVSYSVEHPIETHDVNVTRTLQLLDACKGNIKRFVFASSSSVYGGADTLPTKETYPKSPKSPYALQKSIIEDYLTLYSKLYGLDSASLRFFNVFGPRQLGDSPYSTAVSAWLTAIKRGVPMRSDGDGTQSRDMCYVDNVVDACIAAAVCPDLLHGAVFNVACGDRTTNKQILDHLLNKYPGSSYVSADWRPGDVMHTQADVSEIQKALGYEPKVRFWEGLEKTMNWYDNSWNDIEKTSEDEDL